MTHYLLLINLAAAALILARSACALNEMTAGAVHHLDRLFFSIAATAAVGVLCGPLWGYSDPRLVEVTLNVGFAGIVAVPWLWDTLLTRFWRKSHG